MTTKKKLMTAEELFLLPDDGHFYELLDGVLIEMTPPGGAHGQVTAGFARELSTYVRAHALGVVLAGDPGIILRRNPDRVRAPDVCFYSSERMRPDNVPAAYIEAVPDLIVEIISPGDSATHVQEKIQEWLQAGARLVWAVYPRRRTVSAYEPSGSARVYAASDTIDAEPVLPGFTASVAGLFS